MTGQLALVLALLVAAVVMFARGKPRMDAVALLMLALLPLSGVITINEALSGFSDANVILIALLFVIGEGLVRTGVAQRLGDWLVARAGSSETRLLVLLMAVVAGLGSVMSSTGVVAIFIPIVLRIAQNTGTAPSRLMMPLSVAALISGMMTLVATAPNLVVDAELRRAGTAGFEFFSFTPFGAPILALVGLGSWHTNVETPKDSPYAAKVRKAFEWARVIVPPAEGAYITDKNRPYTTGLSNLQIAVDAGVPALLMFLGLIALSLWRLRRSRKLLKSHSPDSQLILYSHGLEVALIGYVVSANFLSRHDLELLYEVFALATSFYLLAREREREATLQEMPEQEPRTFLAEPLTAARTTRNNFEESRLTG